MNGKSNVLCAFIAAFAFQAGAQDINITGTVTDAIGGGIAGATVSLMSAGISTFTGSGGTFTLLQSTGIRTMQGHAASVSAFVAGGAIRFFVAEPAAVRIDVYSMSGRLVSTALDRTLGRGAYSLSPAAEGVRSGVYFVKVGIGAWSAVCKMSLCGSAAVESGLRMLANAAGRPLARKAAVSDTLVAAKCGYNTFKKFISSYTLSNQVCALTGSGACTQSECTSPVFVTSDPSGGWSNGGYYVHNNMWNSASYQCSETLSACSYHNWYVVANMNKNTGDGAVKTYPNVHKDYNNVPISSFNGITSTFAETSPHVGIYDVAYDIWTNGVAAAGCTEFMIWNENYKQVPSGSLAATVTLGGRTYNVYKTSNNGYIAFIPTVVFTSGTVDILEIFNWTISKGWLPANSTLGQLDFGVEFVSTNGTNAAFKCTDFSITTN
jgi:limonene-1,2-epoxide hydrolase